MHLTIDPTVLVRDLTRVAGATTRGPIAILANCLITADNTGVRMRAGDQELSIETATAAGTITGSGNVDAQATGKADVSILGSGDVTLGGGAKCSSREVGSGTVTCK